jgi:hypothetical protein
VSALRGAVSSSEQWQGEAASRWSATVADRVTDASLTAEVMTKAASLLDQLAADVDAERRVYNQASAQMSDAGDSFNPRVQPGAAGLGRLVPGGHERGIRCMVLDYDTMRGIEREGTLF